MPSDLARVTDTQIYRDCPIYTITIMPMKYDRATGMLRIFTSLDIDIEYTVQAQTYANAPTRSAAFNAYTEQSLASMGINSNPAVSDPIIISISGPGKIPYIQNVSASDFILAKPDAYITNVTYNTGDQTAVVTYYKKENQKAVSVGIRDLNNNIYVVPTSFGPRDNQQTLNSSELANGIYVITLMIDNEIKDTYKLIKR